MGRKIMEDAVTESAKFCRCILVTALLAFSLHVAAQIEPQGTFVSKKDAVAGGYNFWVYEPAEYREDRHPLPLIIFLHGASLCGKNLDRVRRYGVLDAIDRGKIIPMFVLAPQNPGGSWNPQKLNTLLEWMKQNYAIDSTRVYVLGMSLGGYGTLDFVGTYPEKIAAAMALCGGTTLKDMSGLGKLPLWIMHGTADKAVKVDESKRIVSYLHSNGQDDMLLHTWLKGGNHGVLVRVFYIQQTYDWLLSHSLSDSPRTVERDIEIGWDELKSTYYQDLKNSEESYEND